MFYLISELGKVRGGKHGCENTEEEVSGMTETEPSEFSGKRAGVVRTVK